MMNFSRFPIILISIVLAAIIGFAVGIFWQGDVDNRTSAMRGHDLAALTCSRCHNLSASGKSPNKAAPPFRTLVNRLSQEGLQEQLEVALSMGHAPMPPWNISPEQSNDLLAFILSIQEKPKN